MLEYIIKNGIHGRNDKLHALPPLHLWKNNPWHRKTVRDDRESNSYHPSRIQAFCRVTVARRTRRRKEVTGMLNMRSDLHVIVSL